MSARPGKKGNRASSVTRTNKWSDADTVRNIQSGAICRGIFLHPSDLGQMLETREIVVDVSDDLILKGSCSKAKSHQAQFSSESSVDTYESNTDKVTSSKGASASASFHGISLSAGVTKSKERENIQDQAKVANETYLAVVQSEFIPMRSVCLEQDTFHLKPSVIAYLKDIEESLKNSNYRSRSHFKQFFNRYGSHISQGVVEFGGILLTKAERRGFQELARTKQSEIASQALAVTVGAELSTAAMPGGGGAGYQNDNSSSLEKQLGRSSKAIYQDTHITVTKIGGSMENDIQKWKKSLQSSSGASLWHIISREDKTLPIWQLMAFHANEFHSYKQLAAAMEEDYNNEIDPFKTDHGKSVHIRRNVDLWLEQAKDMNGSNVNKVMNDLLEICKEASDTNEWLHEALYNKKVQRAMIRARDLVQDKNENSMMRKTCSLLRELLHVHPCDQISERWFPDIATLRLFIRDPNAKTEAENTKDLQTAIGIWLKDFKDLTEQNAVYCMNELQALRDRHCLSEQAWLDHVIYDADVQRKIPLALEIAKHTTDALKRTQLEVALRFILRPSSLIKPRNFPEIKSIVSSLTQGNSTCDVREFQVEDVDALLREIKTYTTKSNPASHLPELQSRLASTMMKWSKTYTTKSNPVSYLPELQSRLESTMMKWPKTQRKENYYGYYICLSLLQRHGFNVKDGMFDCNFNLEEMQKFEHDLNNHNFQLSRLKEGEQKQAYVMLQMLHYQSGSRELLNDFVQYMRGARLIHSQIDIILDDRSSVNTKTLLTKLKSLICGSDLTNNSDPYVQLIKKQFCFLDVKSVLHPPPRKGKRGNLKPPVDELLKILGLDKYYPNKLKYEDIVSIGNIDQNADSSEISEEKDLAMFFIRNIIGLNSNAREECHVQIQSTASNLSDDDDDSDDEDDDDDDSDDDIKTAAEVHPLDLIYTIMLCADDFLRQELLNKMARCQYAIPFILPPCEVGGRHSRIPTVLKWGMKNIVREFSHNQEIVCKPLFDTSMHIISFMHLENESSWKPKILNEQIGLQNVFWHQELKGGGFSQKLSDGMVDLAWFLAGDKGNDKFTDPVAFLNVRGNVKNNYELCKELIDASSATCIFADKISGAQEILHTMPEELIANIILVILTKSSEVASDKECKKVRRELKMKKHQIIVVSNEAHKFHEVNTTVQKSIGKILSTTERTSLEKLIANLENSGHVDLDDKEGRKGQKSASLILDKIDEEYANNPSNLKANILPCQSDLSCRMEISRLAKEKCRQTKRGKEEQIDDYALRMKNEQWGHYVKLLEKKISEAFRLFLEHLFSLSSIDRRFFLEALKVGLNQRSSEMLKPLYEQYHAIRMEEDSEERNCKLESMSDTLMHASLGLEHFFREMAVLYETFDTLQRKAKSQELDLILQNMSAIMANLLLEGTCMEILDGDAISVPTPWINAVIGKVEELIDTKRVFRVAVLGAQSCGKSTLLNTTFGVNFQVSSGRCTRGVYMQIIKVLSDKELKCDFVIVIDTEGLMSRALEGRSDYDNELATFVVGVTDLILLNIKGEGKEMQDILPLTIHAFLRMSILSENQACHFIHQNMGAVGGERAIASEIDSFVRDLNMKTKAAADDTGQKYTKFTEVIHFDEKKDNTLVPGLWDGLPPMAKTSPGYAETMKQLKVAILNHCKDMAKRKTFYTFSQFAKRLDDVWDAIKYENFVFSFKNVLAVESYGKLTKFYEKAAWKTKTEIRELTKTEKRMIGNEKSQTNLETTIDKAKRSIKQQLIVKAHDLNEKIMHYFKCLGCNNCKSENQKDAIENRHLLLNYETEFKNAIKEFKSSLQDELENEMNTFKVDLQAEQHILTIEKTIDAQLKEGVMEAVKQKKGKEIGIREATDLFDKMWNKESEKIVRTLQSTETLCDIDADVENIIIKQMKPNEAEFVKMKEEKGARNENSPKTKQQSTRRKIKIQMKQSGIELQIVKNFVIKKHHLNLKSFTSKALKSIDDTMMKRLKVFSDTLISTAEKSYAIDECKKFSYHDAEELFKDVWIKIESFKDNDFVITNKYKAQLLCFIEEHAVTCYKQQNKRYLSEKSPVARLQGKKRGYFDMFKNELGLGNHALSFCEGALKPMIMETIKGNLDNITLLVDMQNGQITKETQAVRDIKSLHAAKMMELLKTNRAEDYLDYINGYEEVVSQQIRHIIAEHFYKNDNRYHQLAKKELNKLIGIVATALSEAEDSANDLSPEGENFTGHLLSKLSINMNTSVIQESYKSMATKDTDKRQFTQIILSQLNNIESDIIKLIDESDVAEILEHNNFPDYVFESVVGCTARCPFCKTPCDNHTGNRTGGKHSAVLHRPQGLAGIWNRQSGMLVNVDCRSQMASEHCFRSGIDGQLVKYKDFKTVYPDWNIQGGSDGDIALYWKKVYATHNNKIAEYYRNVPDDQSEALPDDQFPEAWKTIDEKDILDDIAMLYQVDFDQNTYKLI